MRLDAQELMDAARRETGLADYGEAPMQEGLEHFCGSLNAESGMDEGGFAAARRSILGSLGERLKLEDWLTRHPEILDQQITAPVNVIGLPRSGTTALSQFLSEDPALRSIRRWELFTPTPPADDALGDRDPRIAATRAAFEERDRRVPHFRSMLPVSAEDPSEHNAPMSFTFLNLQTLTLYDTPSYEAWMLGVDLTPAYAYLARDLKLMQWKARRERWNLKNPADIFCLPAFVNVFPDAKLAWLHRDPVSTIGSVCSLTTTVRGSMGQTVDRQRVGRHLLDFYAEGVRRAMRDRDARGLQIVDVYNRDVGADPVTAIGDLYAKLGLSFTGDYERRLRNRIAERPRGKFGRHDYTLEEFGLSAAEVRATFKDYTDRFDVPLEH